MDTVHTMPYNGAWVGILQVRLFGSRSVNIHKVTFLNENSYDMIFINDKKKALKFSFIKITMMNTLIWEFPFLNPINSFPVDTSIKRCFNVKTTLCADLPVDFIHVPWVMGCRNTLSNIYLMKIFYTPFTIYLIFLAEHAEQRTSDLPCCIVPACRRCGRVQAWRQIPTRLQCTKRNGKQIRHGHVFSRLFYYRHIGIILSCNWQLLVIQDTLYSANQKKSNIFTERITSSLVNHYLFQNKEMTKDFQLFKSVFHCRRMSSAFISCNLIHAQRKKWAEELTFFTLRIFRLFWFLYN